MQEWEELLEEIMKKMIFEESKTIVTPKVKDSIEIFLKGTLNFVKKYSSQFRLSNTLSFMDSDTELEYTRRFKVHDKIYVKSFRDNSFGWDLSRLEDFYNAYCDGDISKGADGRDPLGRRFRLELYDIGSVNMFPILFSPRARLQFTGYGNVKINPEENLKNILECFNLGGKID